MSANVTATATMLSASASPSKSQPQLDQNCDRLAQSQGSTQTEGKGSSPIQPDYQSSLDLNILSTPTQVSSNQGSLSKQQLHHMMNPVLTGLTNCYHAFCAPGFWKIIFAFLVIGAVATCASMTIEINVSMKSKTTTIATITDDNKNISSNDDIVTPPTIRSVANCRDEDDSSININHDQNAGQPSDRDGRPIIFLDFDGVLNTARKAKLVMLDDELVGRLKHLQKETDSNIVLTTFWRHYIDYVTYVFGRYGIPKSSIIGATPGYDKSMDGRTASDEKEYTSRHEEIMAWLQTYYHDEPQGNYRFVILDDKTSAAGTDELLLDHFVLVKGKEGLSDDDVQKAIQILQKSSNDES